MRTAAVTRTRPHAAMVRGLLALFLVLHGVAHLVGAQVAFEAYAGGDAAAYLAGAWQLRGALLLVAGTLWVAAAVGFALAAWQVATHRERQRDVLVGAASFSLALSALALPEAWIGVIVNAGLLAAVRGGVTARTGPARAR